MCPLTRISCGARCSVSQPPGNQVFPDPEPHKPALGGERPEVRPWGQQRGSPSPWQAGTAGLLLSTVMPHTSMPGPAAAAARPGTCWVQPRDPQAHNAPIQSHRDKGVRVWGGGWPGSPGPMAGPWIPLRTELSAPVASLDARERLSPGSLALLRGPRPRLTELPSPFPLQGSRSGWRWVIRGSSAQRCCCRWACRRACRSSPGASLWSGEEDAVGGGGHKGSQGLGSQAALRVPVEAVRAPYSSC